MRSEPSQKLDPRIRNVWRISALFWVVVAYLACALPFAIAYAAEPGQDWAGVTVAVESAAAALALVLFVAVLPPIRYRRWRYQLDPEYLDISKGIFWRKRYVVPFIRVQNTDTRQGPVMRAFKLSSVTVATAAGNHQIPGVGNDEAAELRDRAAEFARVAREDV